MFNPNKINLEDQYKIFLKKNNMVYERYKNMSYISLDEINIKHFFLIKNHHQHRKTLILTVTRLNFSNSNYKVDRL